MIRRQQRGGRARGAGQHVADDGRAIDGLRDGTADAAVPGDRVLQVEADVGEVASRSETHRDAVLAFQVADKFRGQVVLQDIHLAAQQFQHPHGRIDDAQELDALSVGETHEPQPPRFRPAIETKRPAADGIGLEG